MSADKLYLLIHSLTKSEKTHLKKYHLTSSSKTDSKHTYLYSILDGMKEYDEKKLLLKLKTKINLKFLPQLKKHLHYTILKSLIEYNSSISIDNQLNSLLMEADILSRKLLYKDLLKILHKAETLAATHEKFHHLLQIIDLRKKIFFATADEKFTSINYEQLNKQEEGIAEKIKNNQLYNHILHDCFWALNAGNTSEKTAALEKIKKLHSSVYLKDIGHVKTMEARYAFYHSNMMLALSDNNYSLYYDFVEKIIALLEKNKTLLTDKPYGYLDMLANRLNAASMLKKETVFFETIKKIRALPSVIPQADIPLVNMRIFCYADGMEFFYLCQQGAFKKALEKLPQTIKGLGTFKTQLDPVNTKIFRHIISLVYFANKKYKEALIWQNTLINEENKTTLRSDIDTVTRVLNIIVHCELNNWELVPGLIKAYTKQIENTGNKYELVIILLKHFEQLALKQDELYGEKYFFQELKEKLLPALQNPAEKRMLQTFNVTWWIESKLQSTSMEEIANSI